MSKKRMLYINEINQCISSILDNGQQIPLSTKTVSIEGLGEISRRTLSKEKEKYTLYELDEKSKEYIVEPLSKEKAWQKIQILFNGMRTSELEEELSYWKECASFFEEETKNDMLEKLIEKASVS